jgi:SAM-dependent methyltransferase
MEEFPGYCSICESRVTFVASGTYYRSQLACPVCRSVVRERAIALKTKQLFSNWRELSSHEIAPVPRGFTSRLMAECPGYVQSQWFSDKPLGSTWHGVRNENIEAQTFKSEVFDFVLSLDVMEHVFHPDTAYQEIYRTLKPGGAYVHTFPIVNSQVVAMIDRAEIDVDGNVRHLIHPPEYHGNPVDSSGSLVTKSYGYDIGKQIAAWSNFDVEVVRFCDRSHGLLGDFTEVIVCRKPG